MNHNLTRSITSTFGVQVIGFFLGIVVSIIVARTLQPSGKGLFTLVRTTVEIVVLLVSFGITKALVYEVGTNRFPLHAIASTVIPVAIIHGLVTAFIVYLVYSLQRTSGTAMQSREIAGVAAIVAVANLSYSYAEAFVRGRKHISLCNLASTFRILLYLCIVIILLPLYPSAVTVLLSIAVAAIGALAILLIFEFRSRESLHISWEFSTEIVLALFTYGFVSQVFSLLQSLHLRLDVMIMGYYLAPEQIGYYGTAAGLTQTLWNLPLAASFVLMPWVAGSTANKEMATAKVNRAIFGFVAIAGVLLAVASQSLVAILYGNSYMLAVQPLRILIPGAVMMSGTYVFGSYFLGTKNLGPLVITSIIGLILNLVLNAFLIPSLGIIGAAWASTISYSLVSLVLSLIFLRASGHEMAFVDLWIVTKGEVSHFVLQALGGIVPRSARRHRHQ